MFRFEFPLNYHAKLPKIDGHLRGWSDADLLPALGEMDEEAVFAPVWCCWNEQGIAVATKVSGKRSPLQCDPKKFWKGDNLRLMIDTRDTRNIKRATRFCHHLYFLPTGGRQGAPIGASAPVQRAKEDAPAVKAAEVTIASSIRRDGYTLEAVVPAACLNGFDPDQHRRIGLFYILEDRELGRQALTIGDELPWHVDPSLWASAVLSK